MATEEYVRRIWVKSPAEDVFSWLSKDKTFQRLTPPWERVEVVEQSQGLQNGAWKELKVFVGPLRLRWVLQHEDYKAGRQFCDLQTRGPFSSWKHTHLVEPENEKECYLEDRIEYQLPFGLVGRVIGGSIVRNRLDRLFSYRHRVMSEDFKVIKKYRDQKPLSILVSGSSGLIGSVLDPMLTSLGHQVVPLVRTGARPGKVDWDPEVGRLDTMDLKGLNAVVHLAGENISDGRWTSKKKQRIRDSRVNGTRLLCEKLAGLDSPPRVLVCASAIGFYGDRKEETLTEESNPGEGFLTEVCKAWEESTQPAVEAGIRVVNLRFGVILSPGGGALSKMLLPFRMGLGGKLGSGEQFMSWISEEDAIGAVYHALMNQDMYGPVNVTAPWPVTNNEFTRTLGRVLNRPTIFPVPTPVARLAFGEMADALLLSSSRVQPGRLLKSGYQFQEPKLEGALRHVLGK